MRSKRIIICIIVIMCLLTIIFTNVKIRNIQKEKRIIKENKQIEKKIKEIQKHHSEFVKTKTYTNLYAFDNNKFIEYGEINKDVVINLNSMKIDENTKYFYIGGLGLYIPYEAVEPSIELVKNKRYLNYIPFNKNITTTEVTRFYDENDYLKYQINLSYDFPVIVNDNERYGIEFNNELLFIHQDDIKETHYHENSENEVKNKIKVLTYHAIYNPEKVDCDTSICESLDQFESHLKYIRENDYFTLTLPELEMYLDGKINIPKKSIVLTIDDGTLIDSDAIKLLEQYQVNATLFVVTSWVDISDLKSEYLDLESHTDNMHNQYECPGHGMQGGGILCLPEDQVLNDLKTSQEKLGGSKYFAYPFFDFNARAIKLLKEAGFHMAFIGQYDTDGYSYPKSTDKFKVRRKTIFNDISMDEFISYLK